MPFRGVCSRVWITAQACGRRSRIDPPPRISFATAMRERRGLQISRFRCWSLPRQPRWTPSPARRTEVRYAYHQAHYETRTRQFQGFRSAERIEVGDEAVRIRRTDFTFLMGMEREPGRGPEASALNGSLARTEIYGLDGSATRRARTASKHANMR